MTKPHAVLAEHFPPPSEKFFLLRDLVKNTHTRQPVFQVVGAEFFLFRRGVSVVSHLSSSESQNKSRVSLHDQDIVSPIHSTNVITSRPSPTSLSVPYFGSRSCILRHLRVELLLTMASSSDIVARRAGLNLVERGYIAFHFSNN